MNVTPRAAAALTVLLLAGCETTERIKPKDNNSGVALKSRNDPGDEKTTREDALVQHLEEHPDDAAAWWRLGTYYERVSRFPEAIQAFLGEYNASHSFDFIFSIQDEGQIWVGNKGLDITADVVNGLNAKHRAKKSSASAGGK